MKRIFCITICLFIIIVLNPVFAQIIHVPYDQPTIQEGINASYSGDTVLVHPGVYQETIWFGGKEILVGSLFILTNNPVYKDSTVIQDSGNGYIVNFNSSETHLTRLVGFKITTGSFKNLIHCANASPSIENNIIDRGHKWGIRCDNNSAPLIKQNIFYKTTFGSLSYSSIRIMDSEPVICGNIFNGPGMNCIGHHAIEYL